MISTLNNSPAAGFLYLGLGGAVLGVLGRAGHHLKALLGLEASLLLLSLTVTIANGCQLGLIHQYADTYNKEVGV